MSKELSQDDLDEMQMCLGDCQAKENQEKEEVKKCTNKKTLRQFFLNTIPGNIIIVMILYFLAQNILGALLKKK